MSALARLVSPPATPASPVPALLDDMRKRVSQLGDLSRNYQHLSHERRQRHLAALHTQLRDLHEAMAATAAPAATLLT